MKLSHLIEIPLSQWRLLGASSLLLGLIRLLIWILPFRITLQLITLLAESLVGFYQSRITVEQIIWAVNVSSRYSPGNVRCLSRALTTHILLSWHGYPSELRIGLTKGQSSNLEAHAWIEHQGQVAIGDLPDLSRFIPLSFP